MTDHKKVCWNCGSKNMKPVDTFYQCQDCEATYVPQITLGPVKTVSGRMQNNTLNGPSTRETRRPSPAAAREAQKAREAKG